MWARRGVVALAVVFLCTLAAQAQIVKVVVDDTIQPISDEYIGRALNAAHTQKADAVLIELRTPGGLSDSMRSIIEKILASPVPVIVYVAPSGSYAASAGFFILESADVAAMAPATNTGASHPILMTPWGSMPAMDPVMKEKIENDSAAFLRSVVGKRGRNVEVAETAVRQSKSWTDQEALSQHLIDIVAKNDQDLFRQLDGRTITRFDGSQTTLHLAGKPVEEMRMTLKQQILNWLMDPNMAFILLAIGLLAVYVEFNHPGAIVPGVVGFIFILLAVFALNLLPTRFAALALILGAFILFGLEAKLASHGALGIGGVALLTLGALLLVDGPIPQMRVHLLTALAVSIPLGGITVFLMTIALKARRAKITTGAQGLVGEIGVARTPLAPDGKIFVHGELWNAVATVPVGVGEQVLVQAMEGMKLRVEPVKAAEKAPSF
jgi:membrane-bound serine protease (ClpP class)